LASLFERLRRRFGLRHLRVVADRGMVSQATLAAFEGSKPPVGYIVGVRMRRQQEVSTEVLGQSRSLVGERASSVRTPRIRRRWHWRKSGWKALVTWSAESEEERRKDAPDREAIVAHLRQQLRQGDKSLVGNKGYRRYLKVEGEGHFQIDEAQVKAEARYGGLWVLRTNTVYDAEAVAHV
jgi:hypothetical protein